MTRTTQMFTSKGGPRRSRGKLYEVERLTVDAASSTAPAGPGYVAVRAIAREQPDGSSPLWDLRMSVEEAIRLREHLDDAIRYATPRKEG